MGEAVKLDLSKFVQKSCSSKSDNTSMIDSSTKSSFKDVFMSASSKSDDGLKNIKNHEVNEDQNTQKTQIINKANDFKSGDTKNGTEKVDSKSDDSNNLENAKSNNDAVKTDNNTKTDDNTVQLTDEQKEKLNKVKEILEEILSGTGNGDKKIDELLSKIAKLMSSSESIDTKKEDASKISDNILEQILSAMNIQGAKLTEILSNNSQSEAVNELKQDLNTLIYSAVDDTKTENTKGAAADLLKSVGNNDNVVKSSELKLSQMLAQSSKSDDEKLLEKIKQEITSVTSELKTPNSNETYKNNNKLNTANIIITNDNKSETSAQNGGSNQDNGSKVSQDDKFLNDLLNDSNTSQDDKISNVTNLLNKFSLNNTSEASASTKAPIVTRANFSADIIKSLKYMENNNIKDLTIKIMPKELGEVIIKITSDGGIMKASITASNKEAYSLLNSNLQDLNNSLSNQDIKIHNVEINIYNGDTTFFSGSDSKESGSKNSKNNKGIGKLSVDETDDVSEQDDLYDENSINALA